MAEILGALLGKPVKALGGFLTGWKATGSLKDFGVTLADTGKTLSEIPGSMAGKTADYLKDTFKKGVVRGVGKMLLDSPGGAAMLAANAVGTAVALPIKGATMLVSGATHLLGQGLHAIGQAGGYEALGWAGRKAGEGAWWMTKTGAKGVALEGLKAANGAYMAGKFIWNMRHNKSFQTLAFTGILGGSVAYGGIEGNHAAFAGQMLPYDDFQGTFTNPQPIHNPEFANIPGQRSSRAIDDFGATGDLVFAMNNLRNKGMF